MRMVAGLKILMAIGVMFGSGLSVPSVHTAAAPAPAKHPAMLYVAKNGSDANDGSKQKPFATLEKARDVIRGMIRNHTLPAGGASVLIRGGEYRLSRTFELNEQDSGTTDGPITYQAYNGEKVSLVGGDTLNPSEFRPVTDPEVLGRIPQEGRGKIVQLDLKSLGITDYGELGNNLAVAPELWVNGNAMTLARWPNAGFTTVDQVVDKADEAAGKGYTFTFKDEMPHAWQSFRDAWMLGYWGNDWFTNDLQIKSINQAQKRIETFKGSSYAMKAGQRFYFYNVLEELDLPGEWYLNRENGMLYLYPPAPLNSIKIQLSAFTQDMIRMDHVSNVTLRGMALEVSRGNAITMTGGGSNLISHMEISKMGGYAVKIDGGQNNGVSGCSIYSVGNGGVILNGGDAATLTAAGNYADNNDISNYARIKLTYASAVEINGVGNRVTHNKMHNAPHFAIQFRGNDHMIAYNEIYDVVKETADASAIYSGRSFVWRGNAINYNYIHDIKASNLRVSTAAIYLDDYMSGVEMRGNVIADIGKQAFKLANGRENVVENNLVIHAGNAIAFMARNYKPGEKNYDSLMGKFDQVPYQGEIWSKRYPTLPDILNDEPLLPKRNVVRNNVFVGSGPITGEVEQNMALGTFENNISVGKLTELVPVDGTAGGLQLKRNVEAFSRMPELKGVPFGEMGLQASGLPPAQSAVSAATAAYVRGGDQAEFQMSLNGNRLVSVQDESGKLRKGTDYTLEGSTLVLQKAYLSQLPDGPQPLRLTFSAGNDAFVTVDVHPQP
ncbi:X2-like carbohydrate binding domain-containing protein [Paenibacillus favisporus]|uniref:X2-like carbohydrate binding domain-containing protein n=1 Tax=Paenibacillus favisporus TaxID=221028 RepID=UPI002DBD070A|nr:X2-like carbohydrate binding domain-containing protein [Paenibacillus favisporus]MEC0174916.1 X2-like carbohydrate binding domain-containing protein [Paenibacillus favisporus]